MTTKTAWQIKVEGYEAELQANLEELRGPDWFTVSDTLTTGNAIEGLTIVNKLSPRYEQGLASSEDLDGGNSWWNIGQSMLAEGEFHHWAIVDRKEGNKRLRTIKLAERRQRSVYKKLSPEKKATPVDIEIWEVRGDGGFVLWIDRIINTSSLPQNSRGVIESRPLGGGMYQIVVTPARLKELQAEYHVEPTRLRR